MSKGELRQFSSLILLAWIRQGGHPRHVQNIKDVFTERLECLRWRSWG